MANNFMGDYIDVAERIREFREKYPTGSLQPANLDKPYEIIHIEGVGTRLVYVAAAYRTPDDMRAGIGMAWEPLPGLTSFTNNSELMVAETSAWGRAIVAVLAADTKRGIASADEVRARTATAGVVEIQEASKRSASKVSPIRAAVGSKSEPSISDNQLKFLRELAVKVGADDATVVALSGGVKIEALSNPQASKIIEQLLSIKRGDATLTFNTDGTAELTTTK